MLLPMKHNPFAKVLWQSGRKIVCAGSCKPLLYAIFISFEHTYGLYTCLSVSGSVLVCVSCMHAFAFVSKALFDDNMLSNRNLNQAREHKRNEMNALIQKNKKREAQHDRAAQRMHDREGEQNKKGK